MESHHNQPSAVSSPEVPLRALIHGVGAVSKSLEGVSTWQVLLTLLVLSITYDQGTENNENEVFSDSVEKHILKPSSMISMGWLTDALSRFFCSQVYLEQG